VRDKTPLNIEKLAVRDAAEKVTTPPAQEKYTDFWGNVKKNAVQPGQLVNRKTCPWYLDDLKEQMAMYLGFLAFVEGKKDEALAWYEKILECDPMTRRMDTGGTANNYSRLKWGAEHGYLYAYPQELALFKDPRHRLGVLLCDFYYVTEQWDKARNLARNILDGKYGPVSPAPHEYVQYIHAAGVFRTEGREKAVPEYLKVLGPTSRGNFRSFTQQRAAYAAANLARGSANEKTRQLSRELFVRLVRSPQQTNQTYKARFVLAKDLILLDGRREEGLALLKSMPAAAGDWKALADYYVMKYVEQWQQEAKGATR
jgi:tetratricopeptide (TPR) repeat protein